METKAIKFKIKMVSLQISFESNDFRCIRVLRNLRNFKKAQKNSKYPCDTDLLICAAGDFSRPLRTDSKSAIQKEESKQSINI